MIAFADLQVWSRLLSRSKEAALDPVSTIAALERVNTARKARVAVNPQAPRRFAERYSQIYAWLVSVHPVYERLLFAPTVAYFLVAEHMKNPLKPPQVLPLRLRPPKK